MSQHKIVGHQYFNFDPNKWLILNEFISSISSIWFASSAINEWIYRNGFKTQIKSFMLLNIEHWTAVFQSPQCFPLNLLWFYWSSRMESNELHGINIMYGTFHFRWQIDDGKIDMCPIQTPKPDDTSFLFSTVSCWKNRKSEIEFCLFHCIHFIGNIQRKCM